MATTIYKLKLKKVWEDDDRRCCFLIKDIGLFSDKEIATISAFQYVITLKTMMSNKNNGEIPNKYHFTDLNDIDLFSKQVAPFINEDANNDLASSISWYLSIEEKTVYDKWPINFDNWFWDSII